MKWRLKQIDRGMGDYDAIIDRLDNVMGFTHWVQATLVRRALQ
jgi:hypothetical protein